MSQEYRNMINKRIRERSGEITLRHSDMAADFACNVIAKLKRLERERLTQDRVESILNSTIDAWRERWFKEERDRLEFDPRFAAVIDFVNGTVEMMPANMAAHVLILSINALANDVH